MMGCALRGAFFLEEQKQHEGPVREKTKPKRSLFNHLINIAALLVLPE